MNKGESDLGCQEPTPAPSKEDVWEKFRREHNLTPEQLEKHCQRQLKKIQQCMGERVTYGAIPKK